MGRGKPFRRNRRRGAPVLGAGLMEQVMGDPEPDPDRDPERRVPTFLWMVLGVLVVLVFAAVILAYRPSNPSVYGPPAGAPPTH